MQFILFHGAFGNPSENWLPQLKEKLVSLDQIVYVPQFPVDDWETVTKNGSNIPIKNQTLENWLSVLKGLNLSQKGATRKGKKLCFVAHSLGCVFALHALSKFNLQLDSAIFVSPFLEKLHKSWQIDHANTSFYKPDLPRRGKAGFDFEKLRRLIPISYALYSDTDPYVDKKYALDFAHKLGSSAIFVKAAGHMNNEVNLNEFPLVYELCKTRLDLSLFQKYQEHRRQLYSVDYFKGKSEEVIYLTPKEVFDEGVFKFRNLSKSGFCTLFTATTFWDTQSIYMQEARKASKRIPLTRVFIYKDPNELNRKIVQEQFRLDQTNRIKVYTCKYDDLKDAIPYPDFGIWDEEYVCLVKINPKNEVEEVELSSRKRDIQKALEWQKVILKKAKPISSTFKG